MKNIIQDESFQSCLRFLKSLDIKVHFKPLDYKPAMEGICIKAGEIIIDPETFSCPGDILHEAGHIAVVPKNERTTLNNESIAKRTDAPAEEMMALAWSYAACLHLKLPPSFLFHENGYKGDGAWLVETFSNGSYIGLPMLQFIGLCYFEHDKDCPKYPAMKKWVLD